MNALRCFAYIRVSTKEQDENVQRRAIEDFAPARGVEVVRWYVDKGVSGARPFAERPEAMRLLADLELFKPDCVVAWSIDRLGRSMLDTLNTILMLEAKGVRVITVKEEFLQTLDPNIRKLILGILSWVAEYERRRIRERQEEAWRQGKPKGRPKKVPDDLILKYYRETGSTKEAWKKIVSEGYKITFDAIKKRVARLREQGLIQ